MTDVPSVPGRHRTAEPAVVMPPVGRTALMTASTRAFESRRADRLFADPWAETLLGVHRRGAGAPDVLAGRSGASPVWDFLRSYIPARTPFFDDRVLEAAAAGTRQVVILAAGLDARAARLGLPPDVVVYEVDSEPVLRFKGRALAATGSDVSRRVPVPADLAGDWPAALRAAGHRADRPTVWLAEGLLFYLDSAACTRLADAVRAASAPGSRVAVEYFHRRPVVADLLDGDDVADRQIADTVVPLFDEGPPAPPRDWLTSIGADVDRVTDVAAEIVRHGRDVPEVLDPSRPDPFVIGLASATFPPGLLRRR